MVPSSVGGTTAFDAAIQRCVTNPDDLAAWDAIETMAEAGAETQRIANLYGATLKRELPTSLLLELGARTVRFHDEWAPGDEALIGVLVRVLEIDPTVKWAFDRVSIELTMRARGAELLALYDKVLTAVGAGDRYVALLEEAADVARESAGQIDRAIGYLDRLFNLDPRRGAIAGSLERLLLQQHRYPDLIALWKRRTEVEGPAEAALLRVRAAELCLEAMGDPAGALTTLDPLDPLDRTATGEGRSPLHPRDAAVEPDAVWGLLERILAAPTSSCEVWREALVRLRRRADVTGRKTELVRPLRIALARADASDVVGLHAEIARCLVEDGRSNEATADLAAVISLDPTACHPRLVDALLAEKFEGEVAGCRPRLDRQARRELLRAAAQHAATRAGGDERAVGLYARLLRDMADDAQIIAALDELYRAPERHGALIALRRHELARATDVPRRQALRLDVARLHLTLGEVEPALKCLRENLDELPDDAGTIASVVSLLDAQGSFESLCDILEEHAATMATAAPEIAVELWAKAAEVAERRLSDTRRAMRDHERVVSLSPAPASLDALGRMYTDLGEHQEAVRWLTRLVECSRSGDHAADVFRLATAHVAIGQVADALRCIEAGLRAAPQDLRLHVMQVELQRTTGAPEALVTALVDAAPYADPTLQRSLLREAAKVLTHDLNAPARAAPLLERVVSLPGTDVSTRIELVDTLYRAGRTDEARRFAAGVLTEFGRRHPPERAMIHLLLGRIAFARGEGALALSELESAVATDVGNPIVQLMLGKVSRTLGLFDRAERAFHALLLLQRRAGGLEGDRPPMSETLIELYRLATQRGDEERGAENLAAAFDVATRSEHEAHGLERALREADLPALLLRAQESHLRRATDPSTRVALLSEMSAVLVSLGRHAEAADTALRGLALAPDDARLHESARSACAAAGQLPRYVESLESLIGAALKADHGVLGCALLLRLGEAHEQDPAGLDAAEAAYARAEDTREGLVNVWRRQARLAARRDNHQLQLAVLRRLAASELPPDERTDTLYAVALLELGMTESIDAGLASLRLALDVEPRPAQTAEALNRALAVAVDPGPIAQLYESVARQHGDDSMLLDALSTCATLPHPTQDLLQEAVLVAGRLPATDERATRTRWLLERAVATAREGGAPGEGLWAMRQLISACEQKGDLRTALSWAREAADAAAPEEAVALRRRAASLAVTLGDVDAALDGYERLVAGDPTDVETWSALLALLRETGDVPRLELALARAAEESRDPAERIRLRMERARLIAQSDRAASREALHAVLREQPDHPEAVELLSSLLDPEADRDEIVALLARRLEVVREANDDEAATPLTLRLADLYPRPKALETVRATLAWVLPNAPLLRRLVDLLEVERDATERADAIERLLEHETGPAKLAREIELIGACVATGDAGRVERAVERLSSAGPDHPEVRRALAWLATAKIAEAQAAEAFEHRLDAVRLFRAAAEIHERLGDTDAALQTLKQAQGASPGDPNLLALTARLLLAKDRGREAIAMVTDAVRQVLESSVRGELLATRASLRTALGEHDVAVVDLDKACDCDPDRWLPTLLAALDRARTLAEKHDIGEARSFAVRQAAVLERLGKRAEARSLLAGLPGEDCAVLRALLELDVADARWDNVIQDCKRLLSIADVGELGEIALRLADACEREGRLQDAREGVEYACDIDPSNAALLDRLREVYLHAGAYRELANRLFAEAQRTNDRELRFGRLLEVGRLRVEHLGEPAAAVGPLSDAVAIQPGHHDATLLLADALAAAGLTEDAEALLRSSIAAHGGRRSRPLADLQQRMARIILKQNEAEGLKWLVQALESNPKSAEVAREMARVATALGDFDVAARALRVLTSRGFDAADRARGYLGQAEIALTQANEARATSLARRALQEAPDLEEAQAFLRRLGREA